MEFSLFIPLMVAAIQSSGQVMSSYVSKAKETAKNFVFDKAHFEDTIVESSEQLAEFINIASLNVKQEIKEQSMLDVVQDLQAHVASISELLSLAKTSEITPALAERLLSTGLIPLKTSLKKAEIRLSQQGREDMRLFCHVVGINTLISGYAYLGQTVPTLKKDLEASIYIFQKRLLDSIAKNNREIPWGKIPHLLTTDGISDLVELYNTTLQGIEKVPTTKSLLPTLPSFDKDEKMPSQTRKRKVKEMRLQKVRGFARKLHDLFYLNLICSECKYKGFPQNALECPGCKRKFVN